MWNSLPSLTQRKNGINSFSVRNQQLGDPCHALTKQRRPINSNTTQLNIQYAFKPKKYYWRQCKICLSNITFMKSFETDFLKWEKIHVPQKNVISSWKQETSLESQRHPLHTLLPLFHSVSFPFILFFRLSFYFKTSEYSKLNHIHFTEVKNREPCRG